MDERSYLIMEVNNTQRAKLYMFYPGDEILMVYDEYPYPVPKPMSIDTENAFTWLQLKIVATKKEWSIDKEGFTSKFNSMNSKVPMHIC